MENEKCLHCPINQRYELLIAVLENLGYDISFERHSVIAKNRSIGVTVCANVRMITTKLSENE